MNTPEQQKSEQERLSALRSYNIMDTIEEDDYDRFTEMAALICDTPVSLITLLDENRQWFKSKKGIGVRETPRDIAFCHHAIQQDNLFEIPDATADSRFKENPLVTGDPNIRFYAGQPLIDAHNHNLGTLCVIDKMPRNLNAKQKRLIELLAGEVTKLIVSRR